MEQQNIQQTTLYNLYINEGMTSKQIAEELGYAQSTITAKLHKFNIKKVNNPQFDRVKHSRNKQRDTEEIIRLYCEEQKTTYEIASIFHCSDSTISRTLKKNGVEIRSRELNIIGNKYGELLVVEKLSIEKYLCKCSCGEYKICQKSRLLDGRNKTCGCSLFRTGKKHKSWSGYEDITGTLYAQYKAGARHRNISFKVTKKDMWDQYTSQNKKCAITGVPIIISPNKIDDFKERYRHKISNIASLDRIDNTQGYTKDNIQWILREINLMKLDLTQQKFIDLCLLIGKNLHEDIGNIARS